MPEIRYVIVVHGMGEARPNETLLPVISRFAEARSGLAPERLDDLVTLGLVGSLAGPGPAGAAGPTALPWVELAGIPQPGTPGTGRRPVFTGASSSDGSQLRFAEVWWRDVQDQDTDFLLQGPGVWASSIVARLDYRAELAARAGAAPAPAATPAIASAASAPRWVSEVMGTVRDTVALLHLLLWWKQRAVDELVFSKFLGDVQMYGEYAPARGRAVRRFHQIMARIVEAHQRVSPGHAARFTIIAHSLGTVLGLDALLTAHLPAAARVTADPATGERLLPEYLTPDELAQAMAGGAMPTWTDTSAWTSQVDAYVTLGSPIDKFLTLWPERYTYLTRNAAQLARSSPPIRHRNYCEEQDPVGHHLDLLRATPAYGRVFKLESSDDNVYARCPYPGYAHIAYWQDPVLFHDILARAVDRPDAPALRHASGVWFPAAVFRSIILSTYLLPPLLIILGLGLLAQMALSADSPARGILAGAGAVVVLWISRRLIDLCVWWRQLSKLKSTAADRAKTSAQATFSTWFWFLYSTGMVLLSAAVLACAAVLPLSDLGRFTGAGAPQYVSVLAGIVTLVALVVLLPLRPGAWSSQHLTRPLLFAFAFLLVTGGAVAAGAGLMPAYGWIADLAAKRLWPTQGLLYGSIAWLVFAYQWERLCFVKRYLGRKT